MLTMRAMDEHGKWLPKARKVYDLDENGERIRLQMCIRDSGYSGTNFKRPGFQEMIAAIEAGEIDVVCVKDLSRFGRDYLKVGFYTCLLYTSRCV